MASTSGRERQSHLAEAAAGVGDCHSMTRRVMRRRWCHGLLAPLAALIACALLVGPAAAATSAAASPGQPKLVFWMGTSDNGIFDNQTLDFTADHANIVVLNAPLAGGNGAPSYAQVVAGLHARDPQLPVLLYFWATRVYKGLRAGSVMSQDLPNQSALVLKRANGKAMQDGRLTYGDVASPAYVHWLTSRVRETLNATGVDGVASDVAQREPFPQRCLVSPAFCQRYANGVDTLFSNLKSAIKPKLVIFNGLWANQPGLLTKQEPLLSDTDGAAIEFFGRQEDKPIPSFQAGILPYLQVIQSHPGKRFLVFGRGATAYSSYDFDYLWQRYLYAAYLMVAGPNTGFRYLSTFQAQSSGRANIFTLYHDAAVKIGTPQARYQLTGDLYSRKFSNGLALLVPNGGKSQSYMLTQTLYRPDGSSVSGRVNLLPGTGLVLFNTRPASKPFTLSFSATQPKAFEPAADIVVPAGASRYLAMQALPAANLWQHDLLLDPVKSLSAPSGLEIRLRTKDPAAEVLVVAEVDDGMQKTEQAVAVLDAGGCPANSPKTVRIAFRAAHTLLTYPQQCVSHFLKADGGWHTYTVPSTGVFASRFKVRRWEYLRFSGAMDLVSVSQAR